MGHIVQIEQMSKYVCNRCNYESLYRKNILRHISRTNPCVGNNEIKINVVDVIIICPDCNNTYETYDGLKKHQRISCKMIKQDNKQDNKQDKQNNKQAKQQDNDLTTKMKAFGKIILDSYQSKLKKISNTSTENNTTDYIYLIQTREFINSDQNIYKIGKTKQEHCKRLNSYPIGSEPLYFRKCIDCDNCEKMLLIMFTKKYERKLRYGNEYFEGDFTSMINDINDFINVEQYVIKQSNMI